MSTETKYQLQVEVQGVDVDVVFIFATHSEQEQEQEYVPVLLSCIYPDHRGIWLCTGLRPSVVDSDAFQQLILQQVARVLAAEKKEQDSATDVYFNTREDARESLWCKLGYPQADQLE